MTKHEDYKVYKKNIISLQAMLDSGAFNTDERDDILVRKTAPYISSSSPFLADHITLSLQAAVGDYRRDRQPKAFVSAIKQASMASRAGAASALQHDFKNASHDIDFVTGAAELLTVRKHIYGIKQIVNVPLLWKKQVGDTGLAVSHTTGGKKAFTLSADRRKVDYLEDEGIEVFNTVFFTANRMKNEVSGYGYRYEPELAMGFLAKRGKHMYTHEEFDKALAGVRRLVGKEVLDAFK